MSLAPSTSASSAPSHQHTAIVREVLPHNLAPALRGPTRNGVLRCARRVFFAASAGCLAIAVGKGNFDFVSSPSVNLVGYTLLAFAGSALIGMALRNGTLTHSSSPLLRCVGLAGIATAYL